MCVDVCRPGHWQCLLQQQSYTHKVLDCHTPATLQQLHKQTLGEFALECRTQAHTTVVLAVTPAELAYLARERTYTACMLSCSCYDTHQHTTEHPSRCRRAAKGQVCMYVATSACVITTTPPCLSHTSRGLLSLAFALTALCTQYKLATRVPCTPPSESMYMQALCVEQRPTGFRMCHTPPCLGAPLCDWPHTRTQTATRWPPAALGTQKERRNHPTLIHKRKRRAIGRHPA